MDSRLRVKKVGSSPTSTTTAATTTTTTGAVTAAAASTRANKKIIPTKSKSKERARSTRRSAKTSADSGEEKPPARSRSRKSTTREIKKKEEKAPTGVRTRGRPSKLDKTNEFTLLSITQAATSTPLATASSRSRSPASSSGSIRNRTTTPVIETITNKSDFTSTHRATTLTAAASATAAPNRYNAGYLQFTSRHIISILLSTILLVIFLAILNNSWVNSNIVKPISETLHNISDKFFAKFFSKSSKN